MARLAEGSPSKFVKRSLMDAILASSSQKPEKCKWNFMETIYSRGLLPSPRIAYHWGNQQEAMPSFEVTLIKKDNTGTPIKVTVSANNINEAKRSAEASNRGYRANSVR